MNKVFVWFKDSPEVLILTVPESCHPLEVEDKVHEVFKSNLDGTSFMENGGIWNRTAYVEPST